MYTGNDQIWKQLPFGQTTIICSSGTAAEFLDMTDSVMLSNHSVFRRMFLQPKFISRMVRYIEYTLKSKSTILWMVFPKAIVLVRVYFINNSRRLQYSALVVGLTSRYLQRANILTYWTRKRMLEQPCWKQHLSQKKHVTRCIAEEQPYRVQEMNSILANIFKAKSYPENKDMKTTDIRIILYNICVYIYIWYFTYTNWTYL